MSFFHGHVVSLGQPATTATRRQTLQGMGERPVQAGNRGHGDDLRLLPSSMLASSSVR